MKRASFIVFMGSILASLVTAQIAPREEGRLTMNDREHQHLHGPVKSCTQESTEPAWTDGQGNTHPEIHSQEITEFDAAGHILSSSRRYSGASPWLATYSYDESGRLLKVTSGEEGKSLTTTTYSYDPQGRLQNITDDAKPDNPVSFRYDQQGRKTEIRTFRPEDYRPNVATGGSPFDGLASFPNLPGGGTSTTIYDEHNRPTEIQVRDANGEIVNRAKRTYDAQGNVLEEKQVLDSPELMFPPEVRTEMLNQSGLSETQLRQELRQQITKLMAGHSSLYSVSNSYDTQGRMSHTARRVFNHEDETSNTYNDHGDIESEISRSIAPDAPADPSSPASSFYSEARYSYQYDQHGNWTEMTISRRTDPNGAFQPSTVIKRTLTYY